MNILGFLAWYASRGQSFEVQKQDKGPRCMMMVLNLKILLSGKVHCAQIGSIGWVSNLNQDFCLTQAPPVMTLITPPICW